MLSSDELKQLYRRVRAAFEEPPTPDEVVDEIVFQAPRVLKREATPQEIETVHNYYVEHASVHQIPGFSIDSPESRNRTWYRTFVPPKNGYWSRFYEWMQTTGKLSDDVLRKLDQNSTEVMCRLGNPKDDVFNVRGLVLGDVQSGKTLNYSALINKAVDAGYRVIIILSGILEGLRKQTQRRMEESVTGVATKDAKKGKGVQTGVGAKIGCGQYGRTPEHSILLGTLRSGDFKNSYQTQISSNYTLLFVTKKNKSVLKNLHSWLTTSANPGHELPIEDASLLVIDDEADNASINVKKGNQDPTQINQLIRKILAAFKKSAYVGFTATPYANIFINPDSPEDTEFKDDLFPKDFIHVIPAPDNYVGASRIFGMRGNLRSMVRNIEDIDAYLPPDHKEEEPVPEDLPESLKDALRTFVLASAIRDCRGPRDSNIHRSMLVNVSRFIKVQSVVADRIQYFLTRHIANPIFNNAENPRAERVPDIQAIHSVFDREFKDGCGYEWSEVFAKAAEHVRSIEVKVCNSKTKPPLSYPDDKPYRVIVVGGLAVSRGLTLEGLSTTYLSRNTKMYDALMQMGRWFGYRTGYEDLCHLWMSPRSQEWYRFVTSAHLELVDEFRRMERLNRTPADFGLRVRQDDVTLQITALNKMRNSWRVQGTTSVLGTVMEFPLVDRSPAVSRRNELFVRSLFDTLGAVGEKIVQKSPSSEYYPSVPVGTVLDFLRKYKIADDESSVKQYKEVVRIVRSLADEDSRYTKWTVARVMVRQKTDGRFCVERQVEARENFFRIGKKSAHLSGGKRMGLIGLPPEEVQRIKSFDFRSERSYYSRGVNREPTLVVYPMRIRPTSEELWSTWSTEEQKAYRDEDQLAYGITLGFPDYEGVPQDASSMPYQYRINAIARAELLGESLPFDEYEDDEESE